MLGHDDLVTKFSRSMPERVARATELWFEYEAGKAASLATLRRLLHTLKGDSHMLDLDRCGELAERAEALVDALLRAGRGTALTGAALLGSLEGMTMLALDPRGVEAPKLASLLQQLEAATEELRAGATAGTASAEAVERSSKAEFETAGIEQKGDESTLELAKEKRLVDGRAARFPRALVVEDAPVARELLCGILRGLGLNVEEALDGRQGISMAKSNPPDVLLTDVEMPHMNGVEMLRELKAVPALARVPVIVLTTAGKENRERLEELGVSALLPKQDLTEERLRRLIEDVLPDRR